MSALKARIARAAAERADAVEKIKRAAVDDAPINGALRERDEADARIDALTRERERLETKELPIAEEAERRAAQARRLAAARELHARRVRLAMQFDAALGKAARALADLQATDREYDGGLRALGFRPTMVWDRAVASAVWATRTKDPSAWVRWGQRPGEPVPSIALALGMNPIGQGKALPLAAHVAKDAPPADEDPLEIRAVPENKRVPPLGSLDTREKIEADIERMKTLTPQ